MACNFQSDEFESKLTPWLCKNKEAARWNEVCLPESINERDCKHRADPKHKSVKLGTLHIEICPKCGEGCLDCRCAYEPAPTPGPAKAPDEAISPKPAQEHGYKVGDVVWHKGFKESATIESFETMRAVVYAEVGEDRCWDLNKITPVHRCGKKGKWYIAQPGNLREPFGECAEEPYPVGTWLFTDTDWILRLTSVGVPPDGKTLRYMGLESGGQCRRVTHFSNQRIKEARLPEHTIKCKDCGMAYVLPKEKSNA